MSYFLSHAWLNKRVLSLELIPPNRALYSERAVDTSTGQCVDNRGTSQGIRQFNKNVQLQEILSNYTFILEKAGK
jgi:hypothetical protein